jgi:hypothetical protein
MAGAAGSMAPVIACAIDQLARIGPGRDDEGIREVQFAISTARPRNLFPVGRSRPIWPLGCLWTAQCVVGRLRTIRGLYS